MPYCPRCRDTIEAVSTVPWQANLCPDCGGELRSVDEQDTG